MVSASKQLLEDLVTEILARLPVKSLMRFKCVCKPWNARFRTRAFAIRHASASSPEERLMIFYRQNFSPGKFFITQFLCVCDDLSHPHLPRDVEYPFADKSMLSLFPHGPVNGVFCLYGSFPGNRRQLILWNPATREVKVVPSPHHRPSHDDFIHYGGDDWSYLVHGFGVNPNTNDCMVVSLLFNNNNKRAPSAEVYNLSTNSWTIVHDTVPSTDLDFSFCNTHVNGVFHWLTRHHGCVKDILHFDFSNNRFGKLKLPITGSSKPGELVGVNDSIAYAVLNRVRYDGWVEIWILKEYGNGGEGSWTKLYNIGPLIEPLSGYLSFYGIWKDGDEVEVLVAKEGQPLVSHNSDSRLVRQFPINTCHGSWVLKYVESITPLSV